MVSTKCNSVAKAVRILEEGLMTALDRNAGGALAENLGAVYEYSLRRLIQANARNDDAMLQEVARLIAPIAQGWKDMKNTNEVANDMLQPALVEACEMPEMLIDYYKAIENSSAKMLEAARLKDWDEVVRYEGACAVLIEQLRYRAQNEDLEPEQRKEKTRIMQRILRNDAQIRILAEPWLAQFDHVLEGQPQVLH